jgi:hypothetical protein
MLRLTDDYRNHLLNRPESRMGYKRVDVRLADGRELKDVVVFNAEELEVPDEVGPATVTDVRPHAA